MTSFVGLCNSLVSALSVTIFVQRARLGNAIDVNFSITVSKNKIPE